MTVTKTVTVNASAKSGVGAPHEQVLYGYIRAFAKSGSGYTLTFDPATFLTGKTANQAAAADGVIPKGQPVPNDNYVVNETKRTYVYKVDPSARVTVLNNGPAATHSTVPKLVAIANGTSTTKLWEPLSTGFWVRVDIDTVKSLDQQYHP